MPESPTGLQAISRPRQLSQYRGPLSQKSGSYLIVEAVISYEGAPSEAPVGVVIVNRDCTR